MSSGHWIGINVSKARVDYCCGSSGKPASVANTPAGHARLLRVLRTREIARIVLESTGAYHLAIVATLQDAGLPVSVMTPQLIKWYRESFGRKAKTDPKDARLLAAFGEARRPYPSRVPTANERVLRELVARRDDLVALIGAEKNRLLVARDPRIRHHIAASLADAETRRAEIEREIDHLITGDPLLAKRRAQLRTVPGVGWVTSIMLLAYLPELGEMDRRQIAALTGLAPYADDSGTPHKARHCSGGRSQVRRAMYLAAMTCVTHARVKRTVYRDHYHEMSPAKGANRRWSRLHGACWC